MVTKEEALNLSTFDCPTVTLKDRLLEVLDEIATMRAKREGDTSIDKFIDIQRNHFIGLCGEAAVAGYYSIPMNLTYEHPIDPGYDFLACYTPNNAQFTIDVKTRTKQSADLLVPKKDSIKNVDIYIFCLKRDNEIALYGAIKRDIVEDANIITINNKKAYRVPRDDLNNIAKREYIETTDLEMEGLSAVNVDKKHLITVNGT